MVEDQKPTNIFECSIIFKNESNFVSACVDSKNYTPFGKGKLEMTPKPKIFDDESKGLFKNIWSYALV